MGIRQQLADLSSQSVIERRSGLTTDEFIEEFY
jgi:hypothetical protein